MSYRIAFLKHSSVVYHFYIRFRFILCLKLIYFNNSVLHARIICYLSQLLQNFNDIMIYFIYYYYRRNPKYTFNIGTIGSFSRMILNSKHYPRNEPCHYKTNIVRLRPAWIQTSLRIRAVLSGSMLFAFKLYNK
jgi:hypothetical protein